MANSNVAFRKFSSPLPFLTLLHMLPSVIEQRFGCTVSNPICQRIKGKFTPTDEGTTPTKSVDIGERVARRLAEMDYSGSSLRTLIANIYASADRWEDVTKVKAKRKAIGVKKAPGCSSIEVDSHVHEFLVGDAPHRKMKSVHAMLDRITKSLSGLEDIEMEADNKVAENL